VLATQYGVGQLRSITSWSRGFRDRVTAVIAATGVATLLAGFIVMGTATTAQAGNHDGNGADLKVPVCHATGSETTPYDNGGGEIPKWQITEPNGHGDHGDDIIPAFSAGSHGNQSWEAFPGSNLHLLDILDNGCKLLEQVADLCPGNSGRPGTVKGSASCDNPGPTTSTNSVSVVDCLTESVTTTTTVTTTVYTWSGTEWVGSSSDATDTTTRAAATSELAQAGCEVPGRPKPEAVVAVTSQVNENCAVEEIETVTTTTTTDWVFDEDANEWVEDDPEVTIEVDSRRARPAECPDEVAGVETERPKPKTPGVKPVSGTGGAPAVKGASKSRPEALPTAVDAGLGGPVASTSSSSLLGQGLVGAGLLMLLLAGSMRTGRRERGAHRF
jgi:hypothetical protein